MVQLILDEEVIPEITETDIQILKELRDRRGEEGLKITELKDLVGKAKSTVSDEVSFLEVNGLVEKTGGTGPSGTRITLTDKRIFVDE